MTQRRAGRTVKLSVSLDREDVAALKRLAKQSYGGNLSAAFADAARWLRQQEAGRRALEMLGGPPLDAAAVAAIDAEMAGGPPYVPKRARRRRAA